MVITANEARFAARVLPSSGLEVDGNDGPTDVQVVGASSCELEKDSVRLVESRVSRRTGRMCSLL